MRNERFLLCSFLGSGFFHLVSVLSLLSTLCYCISIDCSLCWRLAARFKNCMELNIIIISVQLHEGYRVYTYPGPCHTLFSCYSLLHQLLQIKPEMDWKTEKVLQQTFMQWYAVCYFLFLLCSLLIKFAAKGRY